MVASSPLVLLKSQFCLAFPSAAGGFTIRTAIFTPGRTIESLVGKQRQAGPQNTFYTGLPSEVPGWGVVPVGRAFTFPRPNPTDERLFSTSPLDGGALGKERVPLT